MVHIVLDSTANVPSWLRQKRPNLHVVPLTVRIGTREIAEDELTAGELFTLIQRAGQHPQTSQPAPGEFVRLFGLLTAEGSQVIVITLSGGLSGTVESAKAAARIVGRPQLYVIDSGTTAAGMVTMAERALAMADDGLAAEQIAEKLQAMALATHTLFVPGTLEYLHKGGRIGGAAALAGSILQIRPVLELTAGKVVVLDKVRTRAKAVARMTEEIFRLRELDCISVVHIAAAEEAAQLQQTIQRQYPGLQVGLTEAGSVLASHLGPGLVGVVFQELI